MLMGQQKFGGKQVGATQEELHADTYGRINRNTSATRRRQ